MRRYGEPLFGTSKLKYLERRKYPPGQHGWRLKNKPRSEYGEQLMEKQKLKFIYGILERQLVRYYEMASKKKGVTGETLLQILESRLDNVLYRCGLAPTRAAARQLVAHGHVLVNGRKVKVPSYLVDIGDTIALTEKAKEFQIIKESEAVRTGRSGAKWIQWDPQTMTAKILYYPSRDEIPENIREYLIVEWYTKR